MLYLIPTKRGLGVELWGAYEDLNNLYNIISKFYNDENKSNIKGFESRDSIISGISYEIRKAKDGNRLKRNSSHYSFEEYTYYGTQIFWVHFLFFLSSIKYNMRYNETNKFDISQVLLIEFWLEKAMNKYDLIGANDLSRFIDDAIYGANDYIYQYMRSINIDYLSLGGGIKAFRNLPNLLKRGIFYTDEYNEYLEFLKDESTKHGCDI
ncbi:DUF6904 family protein [Empedobacter falsenii]